MAEMTKVETYECDEVAHEPVDVADESVEIIEELGLRGQREFIAKTAGDRNTRSPFRLMTADEVGVYTLLCPERVGIAEYNTSPIPARVLKIAAHAVKVVPGIKLMVWDSQSATIHDPVLVGEIGAEWSSGFKRLMIARWGSELEAFDVLRSKALKLAREHLKSGAKRMLSAVDSADDESLYRHGNCYFPSL